ncbi:MAG: hypothetical protein HY909_28305 [Deltaproteobacteria bacterium]|nr:hypothetical protein [Deltaproteobacteria bacterium]
MDPLSAPPGWTLARIDDVTAIALGFRHACALKRDGTVWCWGKNDVGQLGDGGRSWDVCLELGVYPRHRYLVRCSPLPVQVEGLSDIVQVSAALDTSCARRSDGAVFCWGDNSEVRTTDGLRLGILGDGRPSDERCAVPFITELDRSVYPPRQCRSRPVRVVGISDARYLSVGDSGSCVVRSDGTLACWGRVFGCDLFLDGTPLGFGHPTPVPVRWW